MKVELFVKIVGLGL
ncbi:hypothetical protein BOH78_4067 [Pichia kudriavzevii]|nr:hypothetical protein BOH78_5094 [Pichia kudriavzevii]ONH72049.1 hypothetical protein BOH78_4067 [Pichia kudriavzevii]